MTFKWTDELNTGIDTIDAQHQKIVEYINRIEDGGDQSALIGSVLVDLIDYTATHFTYEEQLLSQAGYKDFKEHKESHNRFIERMYQYIERYNDGSQVADDLHNELSVWLYGHIRHEDSAYAGPTFYFYNQGVCNG